MRSVEPKKDGYLLATPILPWTPALFMTEISTYQRASTTSIAALGIMQSGSNSLSSDEFHLGRPRGKRYPDLPDSVNRYVSPHGER